MSSRVISQLVAAMVIIELRATAPLLDLGVYADRLFRSASTVLTLTSVAFFGLLFLLSLFFQDGLHFSARPCVRSRAPRPPARTDPGVG